MVILRSAFFRLLRGFPSRILRNPQSFNLLELILGFIIPSILPILKVGDDKLLSMFLR